MFGVKHPHFSVFLHCHTNAPRPFTVPHAHCPCTTMHIRSLLVKVSIGLQTPRRECVKPVGTRHPDRSQLLVCEAGAATPARGSDTRRGDKPGESQFPRRNVGRVLPTGSQTDLQPPRKITS